MLVEWRASGREVAVLGLGRSGVAATRLLLAREIPVYASEAARTPDLEARTRGLVELGAAVQLGGHDLARIRRAVAVVVSPGIPPDAAPLAAARAAGVPVHAELDVGYVALPDTHCIGITGTNGKTTTTALVAHLLKAAGYRARAAGNIGTPLCEVALESRAYDWLAVEVSSFQLHDMSHFRPAVGVLTNLAPDHLDRYPSMEAYYADKARLFLNATPDSVWVTNADDPAVQEMAAAAPGRHLRFSVRAPADGWYDRTRAGLMLDSGLLIERGELHLLGDHNVGNALVAALAVRAAGAAARALAAGLRSFRPLPHRLEPVREVDGVLWINDSKATNVASTEVALDAVDRPYILLLGGRHKGEPYTRLAERMQGRCRAVVAYGEAAPIVDQDLGPRVRVIRGGDFDDVIGRARALAQAGDAVLLSPACSSYDMFRNYEERGARFRAAVEAM
ncbi:MAG: UDP-N-acetylmuramoyl-L-alanine--D-glutamate ligase [Gemmatimonadales bacterium]